EIDADLGVDAVLGALALLHAVGDREHQAVVAGNSGRRGDGENRSRGCEADCVLHGDPPCYFVQTRCSSLTGMRRGPNGLPNFWNRPGMLVPHSLQARSSSSA